MTERLHMQARLVPAFSMGRSCKGSDLILLAWRPPDQIRPPHSSEAAVAEQRWPR